MTGASFVQRTSSYGSLPGATLPMRKTQKMSQSGSREKERFLAWICKIAGRKGGMLFLVVVSLVFIISLSAVSKDEDVTEVVDPRPFQSISTFGTDDLHMLSHNIPFFPGELDTKSHNNSSSSEFLSMSGENKTQSRSPTVSIGGPLRPHPCERFALPPPPTDPKRTGPRPCPVCYVPVEQAIALMPNAPSVSPVLKNLTYVVEEESLVPAHPFGGSAFGGYPTLRQRNDSFYIKESMNVHCGFVKGNKPGHLTGFDIDDADLLDMEQCRGLVVASAVFGNYDEIQQPRNISETTKRNACFYMFVDEETESFLNKSNSLDNTKRIGIWRVVLVRNLPYVDARRNGKVPKLLLHRMFPNARFSIWIDGKLELVVDPYQILERFLWRQNATFAISRHYRRFDVFVEAEANKAAGKYDTAAIDAQIDFYRREGLRHYSSAKLPITSDVPEGCVIIREHIPITNLFTCLWFNEVDRFTSRDQISFSTVRDKIMSEVDWSINMFLDCERRNFVVQAYHRDVLRKRNTAALAAPVPPLPVLANKAPETPSSEVEVASDKVVRSPAKKVPVRRGREKKSGSRRRRSRSSIVRDNNSF